MSFTSRHFDVKWPCISWRRMFRKKNLSRWCTPMAASPYHNRHHKSRKLYSSLRMWRLSRKAYHFSRWLHRPTRPTFRRHQLEQSCNKFTHLSCFTTPSSTTPSLSCLQGHCRKSYISFLVLFLPPYLVFVMYYWCKVSTFANSYTKTHFVSPRL